MKRDAFDELPKGEADMVPDGRTLFDIDVEMVEKNKSWISWDNEEEPILKPVYCAISFLIATELDKLVDAVRCSSFAAGAAIC